MSVVIKGSSNVNLDFTTGGRITGDFSNATIANRVMFQSSTTNSATLVSAIPSGTATNGQFRAYNNSDPTNAATAALTAQASYISLQSTIEGSGTYLPMAFFTGGSERVRIDTSGNVGIGTSSPSTFGKLVVNAASATTFTGTAVSNIGISGFVNVGDWNGITFNAGGGIPWAKVASQYTASGSFLSFGTSNNFAAGVTNQALTIDPSGNVGIGTSSPGVKLDVNGGAGSASIRIDSTSNANAISLLLATAGAARASLSIANSTSDLVIKSEDAGGRNNGIQFWTGNASAERARIDSSGNLLVGTTTLDGNIGGNSGNNTFTFRQADGLRIAQTGASYWNRYVAGETINWRLAGSTVGSISVSGSSTAYNTSSDYRLKNITGPITTSGAYIDSLNPVEGTWKADGSAFVGLIAHEVQEASRTPVATGTKDGEEMQGMDYSSAEIIANMLAELKSLRARVAQLEAK